jgi:hypothetical protein
MNLSKIKAYAPKARRDFIEAITFRAAQYGITEHTIEPVQEQGDVVIIGGNSFPIKVAEQRKGLEARIKSSSFEQTMEAIASTWFNRFSAIRFMEVHGYMDHGFRVLSHPDAEKKIPEILEQAQHVNFPGLDQDKVISLKLDGTKESELYRMIIIAQCNALHSSMPFLFERLNDETELLLPDNLLHSDSLIRQMVEAIDEDDWQEIEIIGWLYQFYISDKKAEVIGKVVKPEDIPAATQLFTPKWIVQYMVQNSLGHKWMATYPDSQLKEKMDYYIEPAEQTEEAQHQLTEITYTELNPEEITLMDPACGSGHILVEAYDLFKKIYTERGYRHREIPILILEKNLFGLDIDDSAAQLSAFALLMTARADDHRILDKKPKMNVIAIQSSEGLDAQELIDSLKVTSESVSISELINLFQDAKTFGSLIQVPKSLVTDLPQLQAVVRQGSKGNFLKFRASEELMPLVTQAELLATKYDCVVANPPYMAGKYLASALKIFVNAQYDGFEKDLFSAFMIRNLEFSKNDGHLGFMSPFVWMFLSTHEKLRIQFIKNNTLTTLIQLEYSGFDGATVPICTFTINKHHTQGYTGSFVRLSDFRGAKNQGPKTIEALRNKECSWFHCSKPDNFQKIPGSPISYWVSDIVRETFDNACISDIANPTGGMTTGNNDLFLRRWSEVSISKIGFNLASREEAVTSQKTWFPYNKGGKFRKWYGNNEFIVNWGNDGVDIISSGRAFPRSKSHYFQRSITWSATSSSYFGVRHSDRGFIFDAKGSSCFASGESHYSLLGLLCSKQVKFFRNY